MEAPWLMAGPAWSDHRSLVAPAVALLAGTAFALVAESQQLGHTARPAAQHLADFLGGWSFIVAGAVAWARRPASRIGPLIVAVGVTWFVGTFTGSNTDWVRHLARSFQGFYEPLLGVLVLAYPSGRIVSRVERAVAGAWLAEQAFWSAARFVLERPLSWYGCPTCPATVDEFIANREGLAVIGPVSLAAATVLATVVVALALRRVLRAGPAGRRRLVPVMLASGALLLGVVGSGGFRLLVDVRLFDDWRITALYYAVVMLAAVAVLVGLLQDRLARTAVADLVIDLRREANGADPEPGRLRDALARALGDPSLELFLADSRSGRYVGAHGPVDRLPDSSARRSVTLVGDTERPFAAIAHDPSLLDDPGLVAAVASAVRLEADNRELASEVARQLNELRASRARIVTASDAERRRVERDLHDGAQQRLVALSMELGRLRSAAGQADPALAARLASLSSELEAAIEELRELARGILPPILTDAGLPAAVESLALRAAIPVDARVDLDARLPREIESTLYYVIAEALANVGRHAQATRASVRVTQVDGRVRGEIADDGVGGASDRRGGGIQGLRDRVGALGGTLLVDSRPREGTRIVVELPVTAR